MKLKSGAVGLRNEVQQKKSFNSENISSMFLSDLHCWKFSFPLAAKTAIGAGPKILFAVKRILMHGRRHWTMALPKNLLHFRAVFSPCFVPHFSLKPNLFAGFFLMLPGAMAFYLYFPAKQQQIQQKNEEFVPS